MTQSFTRNLPNPLPTANGGTGVSSITDNALIYGDGTNPVDELGPLTDGQLVIGSTGAAPVAASLTSTGGTVTITPGAGTINLEAATGGAFPTASPNLSGYTDFLAYTTNAGYGWSTSQLGSATYAEIGHPGVASLSANNIQSNGGFFLSDGTIICETMVNWKSASGASDTVLIGFANSAASNPTNGVYFRYTNATDFWECVTENTSSETVTTTAITDTAAWRKLRIVINAAGTSVSFLIDDVVEATHITNLPSTATHMLCISITASLVAGQCLMDYIMYNTEATRA